jgi:hypothetical protein
MHSVLILGASVDLFDLVELLVYVLSHIVDQMVFSFNLVHSVPMSSRKCRDYCSVLILCAKLYSTARVVVF